MAPSVVGEAVIAVVWRPHPPVCAMPVGNASLPGPGLLLAARYQSSAAGPFNELTIFEPARRGLAFGLVATLTVVNAARAAQGEPSWEGAQRQVGSIGWADDEDTVCVTWAERALELRAVKSRATLPFLLPIRTMAHGRGRRAAVLPVRGLGHLARVTCVVTHGDDLAPLSTVRRGIVVSAQQMGWSAATEAIHRKIWAAGTAPAPGIG
ncbi:MAG: hypothetical protein NVS3B21_20480 [Acidimicrobiales bacterium]